MQDDQVEADLESGDQLEQQSQQQKQQQHDASIRDFFLREDQRALAPRCCARASPFFGCASFCCVFVVIVPVTLLVLSLFFIASSVALITWILFGLSLCFVLGYFIWSCHPLCCRDTSPYPPVDALPRETSRHRILEQLQSIAVIVNPYGGQGAATAALKKAQAVWSEQGLNVEVYTTERAGHDEQLGRELDTSALDLMVCIGGDGTMHSVINGIMQRPEHSRIPISCIAGGTGNSFMTDLQSLDASQCAQDQTMGRAYPVSLARLDFPSQGRQAVVYSMNTIAFGLVSNAANLAESFRWMGEARYSVLGAWEIMKAGVFHARGSIDGIALDEQLTTLFCNRTQNFGSGLRCCPTNTLQTDSLQVFTVEKLPRAVGMATLTNMGTGAHARFPELEIKPVKRLVLEFDSAGAFMIDGEAYQHDAGRIVVTCVPDAIEFVI